MIVTAALWWFLVVDPGKADMSQYRQWFGPFDKETCELEKNARFKQELTNKDGTWRFDSTAHVSECIYNPKR